MVRHHASPPPTRAWAQCSLAAPVKHTVKLVVVGTSGRPRVDLDAFVVLK
jgi:hypothetical protein